MLLRPVDSGEAETGPSASLQVMVWQEWLPRAELGLPGGNGPICCSSPAHLVHSDRDSVTAFTP